MCTVVTTHNTTHRYNTEEQKIALWSRYSKSMVLIHNWIMNNNFIHPINLPAIQRRQRASWRLGVEEAFPFRGIPTGISTREFKNLWKMITSTNLNIYRLRLLSHWVFPSCSYSLSTHLLLLYRYHDFPISQPSPQPGSYVLLVSSFLLQGPVSSPHCISAVYCLCLTGLCITSSGVFLEATFK